MALDWLGVADAILGDGQIAKFRVYAGIVDGDGQPRRIEIEAAETAPLVGMGLLDGYALYMELIEGGRVRIQSLQ